MKPDKDYLAWRVPEVEYVMTDKDWDSIKADFIAAHYVGIPPLDDKSAFNPLLEQIADEIIKCQKEIVDRINRDTTALIKSIEDHLPEDSKT